MAIVKTLTLHGETVLPKTVSSAVLMEDGSSLEVAMKNQSTDNVKLSAEVAEAVGLAAGASLSNLIINNPAFDNVLASAEIID